MTRVICVTGTDTEVGKTVVTEALAVGLRADGLSVIAVKPVESGTAGPARPSREDGVRLAEATGQAAPRAALLRRGAAHPLLLAPRAA